MTDLCRCNCNPMCGCVCHKQKADNYALEVKKLLTEEFGEHFPADVPAVAEILEQTEDFLKRGKFRGRDDTRELREARSIKRLVERFLSWKLPENFNPDGGISFKKAINENRPSWPQKNEPTGTNLFDAVQAEAMIRYILEE